MESKRYRLSNRAVRDLEEIADYIGSQSIDAADRVIDELSRTFEMLAHLPEIGTGLDDLRTGLRFFVPSRPAANYAVFFYRSAEGVLISDVIHSARDWVGMLSRGER
jgi:toxin ParE1/3/4